MTPASIATLLVHDSGRTEALYSSDCLSNRSKHGIDTTRTLGPSSAAASIHVGDFYNKSNIRVHYYALKADTDWELDTDYELLNDEARDLTHNPDLLPSMKKSVTCAQDTYERDMSIKRKKAVTMEETSKVGKSIKLVASIVACKLVDDCVESVSWLFERG